MRIAIISDSHGNLTALDAVLDHVDYTGPYDAVLMGGDVAYGGPFPAQCMDRVIERGLPMVRGNTDQMILDAIAGTSDAHAEWVVDQLEERHFEYLQLATVQYNVEIGMGRTLGLVHATPWSIHDSVLPDSSDDDFRRMLFEAGTNVLAYGHIHLQHQRTLDIGLVVAVGSLGLPFDGDRRAMYTVVDAAGGGCSIEFQRLDYDVERAIAEAQRQGGPNGENFANTLINAQRPG